ncbi:hypothetical protein CAL7716_106940 (plasmid) [Calothrix sp. PCC 7716]|nr:hypothetical protein CAL7716_106940 [Calothrix sp. PCC 7716]
MSDYIAIIALIVSIISILVQNFGVQKQLLVSNISTYTERYQKLIDRMPKEILYEDFDIYNLSENGKEELLRSMCLYFDLCFEEYLLYQLKLIDKKLWNVWKNAITSAMSRPAFRQGWKIVSKQTTYSFEFINFMNQFGKV